MAESVLVVEDSQTYRVEVPTWTAATPLPTRTATYSPPQHAQPTPPPVQSLNVMLVPGQKGDQGPPGRSASGRRWYGEGPPGTIVGSIPGDEYVDTLNGDLYYLT